MLSWAPVGQLMGHDAIHNYIVCQSLQTIIHGEDLVAFGVRCVVSSAVFHGADPGTF